MDIVSQGNAFCHRTERLHAFMDEVRRLIYNECFNKDISVASVDCFCHDMFICMNRDSGEYTFPELLGMLTSTRFIGETFNRYQYASSI